MFSVCQKVAHPMHGAGIIENVVTRCDGGEERSFYTLKLCIGSLVLLLPCDSCEAIGLRPIISAEIAREMLKNLALVEEENIVNWNQRYRENMDKIKSGSLAQVLVVIKTLLLRENSRGLSNGERKMLTSAKKIAISEFMLALGEEYSDLENIIVTALS